MKVTSISGKIVFDNGTEISDYHEQDCCEIVYADFSALQDTSIFDVEFYEIKIEGVFDTGFRLNGFLVPCYSKQNGYYSHNLTIHIKYPDGKEEDIDVTEYVNRDDEY